MKACAIAITVVHLSFTFLDVLDSIASEYITISLSDKAITSCGPRSKWIECGPACQKSCATIDVLIACLSVCTPGCFCEEGYIREFEDGPCIAISECPPPPGPSSCRPQEKWTDCGVLPDCERTCANGDSPIFCPKICVPGCFCEEGYVREFAKGPCIARSQCPPSPGLPSCGPQEKWTDCGVLPDCERTCANGDSPILCPAICIPGCFCEEGYVREFEDGPCIAKNQCPRSLGIPACGPQEKWSNCSVLPACQPSCTNSDNPIVCPAVCVSGCSCEEGYIREFENGPCIAKSECPGSSGTNRI